MYLIIISCRILIKPAILSFTTTEIHHLELSRKQHLRREYCMLIECVYTTKTHTHYDSERRYRVTTNISLT